MTEEKEVLLLSLTDTVCVSLHEHDCLSEIPIQLCLNKVNELDDKIVWTPALEPETDGEKSESRHVHEFHKQRTRRRRRARREEEERMGRKFKPDINRISEEKKKKDEFFTQLHRSQKHKADIYESLLPGRQTLVIGG